MKIQGLSQEEVRQRKQQGLVNIDTGVKTKTIGQIVLEHTVTLFNLLNVGLALALILVGSFKNMLFMGVVICNTAIGIIQEIRSKHMVDQLAIVVSNRARVIRGGVEQEIPVEEIVKDDYLHLGRGNQIPADCRVEQGHGYLNESLVTGESDLIYKQEGDLLLSGSFFNSGDCIARVIHVGAENYAAQISSEAKMVKEVHSEIMSTLKKIIRYISIILLPLGALLFYNQLTIPEATLHDAVVNTVAALIGMIPEGLMLLTSSVLAVSVIRLSKSKVLVQQLYCIETLARVDVLCLDKTGTITCDRMQVEEVQVLPDASEQEVYQAFRSLAVCSRDEGATIEAIRAYFLAEDTAAIWKAVDIVDFSSERKWSGALLDNGYTYVMGAAEMIAGQQGEDILRNQMGTRRAILLARSRSGFGPEEALPEELEMLGFVLIQDEIREDAPETIRYFCEQGVQLKVISGDGVETVSQIAMEAGIPQADQAIDARRLQSDEALEEAAERYQVFGRVTPMQKRKLITALQKKGHTVAMTGDGVNDVLALREADCSVAMASGSDAARNVSQLVLTNSNFAAMPRVVAEGRRAINNIQRSASLFLVKTLFSICIGILFVFMDMRYPFQPIQMSFIGVFTIGLPSFVLALEPNKDRIKGNFFFSIITRAVAGAVTMTLGILLSYAAGAVFHLSYEQTSTLAVILTAATGVFLLIRISLPFNALRLALLIFVICGIVGGVWFVGDFLGLAELTWQMDLFVLGVGLINAAIFAGLYWIMEKIKERKT